MKTAKIKLFIVALAIMMFPAMAFAQEAFMSKLTIKLTVDQTVQTLAAKDDDGKTIKPKELVWENEWMTDNGEYFEIKAKIQTTKIGNKEILEWLVDAGVIEAVKGSTLYLLFDQGVEVIVEVANGRWVSLDGIIVFGQTGPGILELDVQEEWTEKNGGKLSVSERMKFPVGIEFSLEERESILLGFMDMSINIDVSEKKQEETYKFNGGDISPLGGILFDMNSDNATECFEDECIGLVEGSIKIGKGKELDII